MKSPLTLIMILLFGGAEIISAQDFGAVGTTWYYTLPNFSDPSISYVQVVSVGDTIVNAQPCHHLQVLHGSDCSSENGNSFVFDQAGIVYYFVSQLNQFEVLYNFNLQTGDLFKLYVDGYFGNPDSSMFQVEGAFTDTINGIVLKKNALKLLSGLYSFSTTDQDTIEERIGAGYLLPQYGLCEAGPNQLRCFQDSLIGNYSTNVAPSCDFISSGINDPRLSSILSLSPNPTTTQLNITLPSADNDVTIQVFDVQGRKIFLPTSITTTQVQLNTSSLPNGFYTLQLTHNKTGVSEVGKFVKQ